MKQVAIFDDFYTDSQDLEQAVNEWVKEYKVNVLNIDVKTYISTFNVWYAVVTYEDERCQEN